MRRAGAGRGSRSRWREAIIVLIACITGSACSRGLAPGETEEVSVTEAEVPAVVREAAIAIAARIGAGHCNSWFYDREDQDWECEFTGLARSAELDILPDGSFSELELVYEFEEIEAVLGEEAAYIRENCRNESGVLIELSLRREVYLDDIPDLAEAWSMSGVVLEFQCPNGNDFEVDSLHKGIRKRADDKKDISTHGQPGK